MTRATAPVLGPVAIAIATVLVAASPAGAQPPEYRLVGDTPQGAPQVPCETPDRPPRATRMFIVERAYPQRLIEDAVEGAVTANVNVAADGTVTSVDITSSTPPGLFDEAVRREVARMRFQPALRRCEPVAGVFELSVRFRLSG